MANGKLINIVNSVHRRSYTAGDLRFASRRARGRPRLRAGVGKAPAWLPCASGRSLRPKPSPFFAVSLPLFSRCRCHNSVERLPSNQRLRHHSKACPSSASSLRASKPVLVACLHRKLAVRAFLPRGWQRPHRERFAVARAPRYASAPAESCFSFTMML